MTSNAADLLTNLDAFKSAAYGMTDIGIGPSEAARMMGTYAMASGASADNVIGQSRALGEWSKATGVDPTLLAHAGAVIGQNVGNDQNKNMGQIFGAASQEGDFGRRQTEMLGTIASLLSKQAASTPGGQPSLVDALREITGITSLGGYFATTAGAATTLSAEQAFGAGTSMYDMQLESRAGWSPEDMLLGSQGAKQIASKAKVLYGDTEAVYAHGTDQQKMWGRMQMEQGLRTTGMSSENARAMAWQLQLSGGKTLGGDIAPADKDARIAARKASPAGIAEATAANLEAAQTKLGDDALKNLGPIANGISELVNKFSLANTLLYAIAGFAGVQALGAAGGVGGLAGKLLGLGRLGAPALEALGGLGLGVAAGTIVVGGVAAGKGMKAAMAGGDADRPIFGGAGEDTSPDAAWRKGSNAMSDRAAPPGMDHDTWLKLVNASKDTGFNPYLLAGVANIESGFGKGGGMNTKPVFQDGRWHAPGTLGDKEGGIWHGHGMFQVDPSSGTSPADMLRAETDVDFAARQAIAHLQRNFKRSGIEGGLNEYNSGAAAGSSTTYYKQHGISNAQIEMQRANEYYHRGTDHDVKVSVVVIPKDNTRVKGGTSRTGAYTA